MKSDREPLMSAEFEAEIVEWRGPAPFLFAVVPDGHVAEIKWAARSASYGWGCVPVAVRIGSTRFTTSLFPRDGSYLLPIKLAVQRSERVGVGDHIPVMMRIDGPPSASFLPFEDED